MQDDNDGTVEVLKSSEGWTSGPRGSLADKIPSCTIEQANQEIRQLTTKESKGKCGPYKYVFK